jgi:hypothetical protein
LKKLSGNSWFLRGKAFEKFRSCFLSSYKKYYALYEPNNTEKSVLYWQFIVKIITQLFKIDPIQVWNDFNGYLTTKDPTRIAMNDEWPKNTPWDKYFDNKEFYEIIDRIEWSETREKRDPFSMRVFPRNKYDSDKLVFRKRGILLAYYMLKILCDEYPPDAILRTDIQPALTYLNSNFFIYTDIIEPNIINDQSGRILIQTNHNVVPNQYNNFIRQCFSPIQYKKCAAGIINLETIHIYIYSVLGEEMRFQRGPVFIELHFIRERSL